MPPIVPARVIIDPRGFLGDGNAKSQHPADRGTWVWCPGKSSVETAFLRFRLAISLSERVTPLVHVTADQRFQLRCDGQDVTFGPDRSDLEHWTVQTVQLDLAAGKHEIEVLAWWIADPLGKDAAAIPDPAEQPVTPPMAQVTWRGGFLLYAEGVPPAMLDTGSAAWVVYDLTDAVKMQRPQIPHYNDVGPWFAFGLDEWQHNDGKPVASILGPLVENGFGVRRPGWRLYPAELPEQRRERWTGGRIRIARPDWDDRPFSEEETRSHPVADWEKLLTANEPLTIPPHGERTVLWDFEDYVCGYPSTEFAGGAGAVIEWNWAEAPYQEADVTKVTGASSKGHRGQIEGKVFVGIADRWLVGRTPCASTPALWWRAGRYVRLRFKANDAPLTITRLSVITTGYPLHWTGKWHSSDQSWDRLMPLFQRAFECSAHETWTDTPYYEQMCYVGDNIMHAVSNYAWSRDDRPSRRSVRLFEWSRRCSGLVAERYPSRVRQESATYSLLWPMMVRDYAWWRDDSAFIREMLPGVRSVLAEFDGLAGADGVLHHVPGWPFVDWVPEWSAAPGWHGYDPAVDAGDSSIINLHWVLALLAAAQIEQACGDPGLMHYYRGRAQTVFDRVIHRYWDPARNVMRDGRVSDAASEHAQVFALLTGLMNEPKTAACLAALRGNRLTGVTISFSFYLLDVLYRHGQEDEFWRRLAFWRGLPDGGFKSTPEGPEPGRSDAHAWGAHPAWHTLASIAGVRPASPGFTAVRIAPMPGVLTFFNASVVHPRGTVDLSFRRETTAASVARFAIRLPEGIAGTLVYGGIERELLPGENRHEFT